jgi:DNA-directed RNA polymerase beta' subunit
LSVKQKAQHDIIGLKRPDVLAADQAKGRGTKDTGRNSVVEPAYDDASDSELEPESDGEDVWSENEDQSRPATVSKHQLPKSASGKVKTSRGRNERVMPPVEARAHLRRLFEREAVMCSLLFGRHGPYAPLNQSKLSLASADMFFLEVLPVTPTRFRPPAKMNDMLFEHPQNELLTRVLITSYTLRDLNASLIAASAKSSATEEAAKTKILQSLLDNLIQLQVHVNSFIDSSKNPQPVRQGKLPPSGVKQLLEKKEGLFRKHMMVRTLNRSLTLHSFLTV